MQSKDRYIVLVVGIGICILASLLVMPYVPDDSYISFRYAENLVDGHGLTFNRGEPPVEAYSNFVWIVLCAVVYKSGAVLPNAMPLVGILMTLISVFFLWRLFCRRGFPAVQMLLPILLFATSGPVIAYAVSGLETPLYTLLLLLTIDAVDAVVARGRLHGYLALAGVGVLLALCRPEGIVVFPFVFVVLYWLTRKPGEKAELVTPQTKSAMIAIAAFVVVIAAYTIWRINYFGELLPTPLFSKGGGGQSLPFAWRRNFELLFVREGSYGTPLGFFLVALATLAVLGLRFSKVKSHLKRSETVALSVAIAHIAIYVNFEDWMPGLRYYSTIIALLLIPAAHVQTPWLSAGGAARVTWRRYAPIVFVVFCVGCVPLMSIRIVAAQVEQSNQKGLVALAVWLKEHMPASSVLAMSDVGAIPYYTGFKTIDIHTQSLTDLYIAKEGFSTEYFYQRKPDIVIFPSNSQVITKFQPEHFAIAEDKRFQRMYKFLGAVRLDWYNDRSYWVFIPRAFPEIPLTTLETFPTGVGTLRNAVKK